MSGKLNFHSFASSIKQNYSNKNDHPKRYKKIVKKDNFVIFTNITFFYHLTICVSSISITMKLHHIEIIYRSTVLNYVSNKKLENKPYMFVFETCSRLCFAVRTSCCSLSLPSQASRAEPEWSLPEFTTETFIRTQQPSHPRSISVEAATTAADRTALA